jgi:PPM family protein phosphatase
MSDATTSVSIDAFGQSDVGLVRKNNEDSFLVADLTTGVTTPDAFALNQAIGDKGSLLLVADGMGGVEAGEVASRMAAESVAKFFFDQLSAKPSVDQKTFVKAFKQSIHEANRSIFEEGQRDRNRRGMGTTLTAAAVHGQFIFFAQLGDSRAYLARNNSITSMTRDQSLVAQLVASGSLSSHEAKTHPQRNVILQALGVQRQVEAVLSFTQLKRGDQLVLCSDGLWGKVEAEEIKELLEKRLEPKTTCQNLVQLARERGGEDNITVIVACFNGEGLAQPGPDEGLSYERIQDKPRWRFWPWGS